MHLSVFFKNLYERRKVYLEIFRLPALQLKLVSGVLQCENNQCTTNLSETSTGYGLNIYRFLLRLFIGSELTPKIWKTSVLIGCVCTHKGNVRGKISLICIFKIV